MTQRDIKMSRVLRWSGFVASLWLLGSCATTDDVSRFRATGPAEQLIMSFDGGTERRGELGAEVPNLPGRVALEIASLSESGASGVSLTLKPRFECQVAYLTPREEVIDHKRSPNGWGTTMIVAGSVASVVGLIYSAVTLPRYNTLPPPSPLATENENRQDLNAQVIVPLSILGGGALTLGTGLLGQLDTQTVSPAPSRLDPTEDFEACGGEPSIPALALAALTFIGKEKVQSVAVAHEGRTLSVPSYFGDPGTSLDARNEVKRLFVAPRTCLSLPELPLSPLSWASPSDAMAAQGLAQVSDREVSLHWSQNPIARARLKRWRVEKLVRLGKSAAFERHAPSLLSALRRTPDTDVMDALREAAARISPDTEIPEDGGVAGSGALRVMVYEKVKASREARGLLPFISLFPDPSGALYDKVDERFFEIAKGAGSEVHALYLKKMSRGAYTREVKALYATALMKEKAYETFLLKFDASHPSYKKARKAWLGKAPRTIARQIAQGELDDASVELDVIQGVLGSDDPLVVRLSASLDAAYDKLERSTPSSRRAQGGGGSSSNDAQCVSAFWGCSRVCKDAHCLAVADCIESCMIGNGFSMDDQCPAVLNYQVPCRQ